MHLGCEYAHHAWCRGYMLAVQACSLRTLVDAPCRVSAVLPENPCLNIILHSLEADTVLPTFDHLRSKREIDIHAPHLTACAVLCCASPGPYSPPAPSKSSPSQSTAHTTQMVSQQPSRTERSPPAAPFPGPRHSSRAAHSQQTGTHIAGSTATP
jgi:hypothetical protein